MGTPLGPVFSTIAPCGWLSRLRTTESQCQLREQPRFEGLNFTFPLARSSAQSSP
jgi:hypothetical protein